MATPTHNERVAMHCVPVYDVAQTGRYARDVESISGFLEDTLSWSPYASNIAQQIKPEDAHIECSDRWAEKCKVTN